MHHTSICLWIILLHSEFFLKYDWFNKELGAALGKNVAVHDFSFGHILIHFLWRLQLIANVANQLLDSLDYLYISKLIHGSRNLRATRTWGGWFHFVWLNLVDQLR